MESHGTALITEKSFWNRIVGAWFNSFWDENAIRLLAVGSAMVLWWAVSSLIPVDYSFFLPGPERVLRTIIEAFQTEALGDALLGALLPLLLGYLLAVVIGVPLGILMGVSRNFERLVDPYVNGFYVTPISVLIPAMIFWFGVGFEIRVMVAFLFTVFVITVNTLQGTKHTPNDFVELARSFGASRFYIIRHVVIPNAIPYIMVGLRLGIGRAMRGVVISELIIAITGIGIIVSNYNAFFRIDGLLAVAVAVMIIGILLAGLVQWLENLIAPWKKKEAAFQE